MKLYFNMKVDCEATQRSVNNAALGERSTRGFADLLNQHGVKGTFFVIAGDIEVHAALYLGLEKEGHEVALHLHPGDLGYQEFAGIYGPDEQRKMIDTAAQRFAQAMGRRPLGFCMGYGSCNDHTFPVLADLQFKHGQCSIPSRILPECASVWAGAPLDIHYAHRYNRLLSGDLDFVEIPSTLDPDSRMWGGKHPQDLRVELVDAKNHYYTIEKSVRRQIHEDVPVFSIKGSTHNIFEFGDPRDFRRETAEGIITATKRIAEANGLTLLPATTETMAAIYRKTVPLPKDGGQKVDLDTRGRKFSKH